MYYPLNNEGFRVEEIPDDLFLEVKKNGDINGRPVVEAQHQISKGWFILAIIIGSLVVIGAGGFGSMGLLQSHNLISLPQWLTSAIGTVGNTSHFWSLWTMAIGGVVVGGGLIAFGAYNVHQARITDKELQGKIEQDRLEQDRLEQDRLAILQEQEQREKNLEQDKQKKEEELKKQKEKEAELAHQHVPQGQVSKLADVLNKVQQPSMKDFEDNFAKLGIKPEDYKLENGKYETRHFGKWEGNGKDRKFIPASYPDKNFIVIKTHDGTLLCTGKITQDYQDSLEQILTDEWYEK